MNKRAHNFEVGLAVTPGAHRILMVVGGFGFVCLVSAIGLIVHMVV